MRASGCMATETTFGTLIDACVRAGERDLALRVYHKALRDGATGSVAVYSSAIEACSLAEVRGHL